MPFSADETGIVMLHDLTDNSLLGPLSYFALKMEMKL